MSTRTAAATTQAHSGDRVRSTTVAGVTAAGVGSTSPSTPRARPGQLPGGTDLDSARRGAETLMAGISSAAA
jgi:hypothetical protein